MQLIPASHLPALELPRPDICWLNLQGPVQQTNLLVYATARDFLSAPKTYTVLEFTADPVECLQLSAADYREQAGLAPELGAGIYTLDFSAGEADTDASLSTLLILTTETAWEISYRTCCQAGSQYFSANSQLALSEYLATLET